MRLNNNKLLVIAAMAGTVSVLKVEASLEAVEQYSEVQNECDIEYYTGFENVASGTPFIRKYWQEEGLNPSDWDNGLADRTMISSSEAAAGNSALEVSYPKEEYGSTATGAQVELNLEPQDEYYASYKVKFSDDFSWGTENKGGKLPGLTGGDKCGDDFKCDGTDGFSARYMWRNEGNPELYLYSADMENEKYGDDIYFMNNGEKFQFERGKWYTITERVKLNTSATADDGIVEIWVDGEKVVDLHDITFVTNDQLIDTFYFSTFHGGHDQSWAPDTNSNTYFDELKIATCSNGVDF